MRATIANVPSDFFLSFFLEGSPNLLTTHLCFFGDVELPELRSIYPGAASGSDIELEKAIPSCLSDDGSLDPGCIPPVSFSGVDALIQRATSSEIGDGFLSSCVPSWRRHRVHRASNFLCMHTHMSCEGQFGQVCGQGVSLCSHSLHRHMWHGVVPPE